MIKTKATDTYIMEYSSGIKKYELSPFFNDMDGLGGYYAK